MKGRISFYGGNDVVARKQLLEALSFDPDCQEIKRALEVIKLSPQYKEKATDMFKKEQYAEAIDQFVRCTELDELNCKYNAIAYFNMALCFSKLKKNEDALKCLNKAVAFDPKYAKAFYKRGEINQALNNHEDAVKDF